MPIDSSGSTDPIAYQPQALQFYIVQAIGSSPTAGPPAFFTFLHWCRIGEFGQANTLGPFSTSQEAVQLFLTKVSPTAS